MTEDHHRLGAWCHKIRRTYQEGKLSDEWFEKLSALNFRWESNPDLWEEGFQHAKAYYEEHGHLSIGGEYSNKYGTSLNRWLSNNKAEYDKDGHGKLSSKQVELLESIQISMRTRKDVCWMKGYLALKQYVEDYGDTLVPSLYCTETGFGLGDWVKNVKTKYKKHQLTKQQIAMLDELHFDWVKLQRGVKKGTQKAGISYDSKRIKLMDDIGMVWNAQRIHSWDEYIAALVEFKTIHGHMCLPRTYMVGDMCVSNWVKLQRTLRNQGELSQDKIDALDAIGFPWDYHLEEWKKAYIDAKAYYEEFGNMDIPKGYKGKGGTSLKLWWDRQRRNMKQKPESFSDEQIRLLLELGLD